MRPRPETYATCVGLTRNVRGVINSLTSSTINSSVLSMFITCTMQYHQLVCVEHVYHLYNAAPSTRLCRACLSPVQRSTINSSSMFITCTTQYHRLVCVEHVYHLYNAVPSTHLCRACLSPVQRSTIDSSVLSMFITCTSCQCQCCLISLNTNTDTLVTTRLTQYIPHDKFLAPLSVCLSVPHMPPTPDRKAT